MRKIIVILMVGLVSISYAQVPETEEVELTIGDTLYFDICTGENFEYIDYYVKTRFESGFIDYDTINGQDYYSSFFNTGDFDVVRLPCTFRNKYGVIKHMMTIDATDNKRRNIIVVMIENGVSAAHIVEEAFMSEEVRYVPLK